MRFWLDTEFNGFCGALISMALVSDDGHEWYEALPCSDPIGWVTQNVIPTLGKAPLSDTTQMALSLRSFLAGFDAVHIVADWPEDISHFCNTLIIGRGICIDTPPLSFEIRSDLPSFDDISAVPHNALEDARAMRTAGVGEHNTKRVGK